MADSVITCDEIIESHEETNTISQILMKRKQPVKRKIFIFYLHFINYYSIIDSCYYLPLLDKILSKTKTVIIIS